MPKVTAANLVTRGGLSLREVTRNAATVLFVFEYRSL